MLAFLKRNVAPENLLQRVLVHDEMLESAAADVQDQMDRFLCKRVVKS